MGAKERSENFGCDKPHLTAVHLSHFAGARFVHHVLIQVSAQLNVVTYPVGRSEPSANVSVQRVACRHSNGCNFSWGYHSPPRHSYPEIQ